ncbi:MAG: hypothetical protein FK734_08090 [Asgard group archaeon]|nr:hypothetical protein [Asgard group archaeon]
MKMKKVFDTKNWFLLFVVILLMNSQLINFEPVKAANPGPFFSISILSPNTDPARNQWATLMAEQLPKIGIAVDTLDLTGWAQIAPRTFSYPGPYPIPTYSEGGYDILFVSWTWDIDFDPTGLYDSPSITPSGDNFYQYFNPEMDWAIANYTTTFVLEDRIGYAEDIQALLYEDLPEISIVYPLSVYPMDVNFDLGSWDGLLWATSYQPMESWTIPGQTEFHYACPADFEDFHPYFYESMYDGQWLHQIYNGLLERKPSDRWYEGRLLQSFTSADGITYNIELKPNVKWADGTPLTTQDIQYSYQLLIDPDFGSPDIYYWSNYIDKYSVTIIDTTHCTIEFLKNYVFQDGNLAVDLVPYHIWSSIANDTHAAQAISWASSDPNKILGAGPYYLQEYDGTNGVIHLKRNAYFDDWSGITPYFEDVYFEFYSNKEGALSALAGGLVDMVDAQFSVQLDEVPSGAKYQLIESPRVHEIAVNCLHPYLGTGELCPIASPESGNHIRKAISYMIPRQIIVDEILDGLGTPGVTGWSPVSIGYDDSLEPLDYNIELAKYHMALAGFDIDFTDPSPSPSPTGPTTITLSPTVSIGFAIMVIPITLIAGMILINSLRKQNK